VTVSALALSFLFNVVLTVTVHLYLLTNKREDDDLAIKLTHAAHRSV